MNRRSVLVQLSLSAFGFQVQCSNYSGFNATRCTIKQLNKGNRRSDDAIPCQIESKRGEIIFQHGSLGGRDLRKCAAIYFVHFLHPHWAHPTRQPIVNQSHLRKGLLHGHNNGWQACWNGERGGMWRSFLVRSSDGTNAEIVSGSILVDISVLQQQTILLIE